MKAISICLLPLGLLLSACGARTAQPEDSQTHWLQACDDDSDCGDLSCECGRCVETCGPNSACVDRRTCFSQTSNASASLCADEAPVDVCLVACDHVSDCDHNEECLDGACIPTGLQSSGETRDSGDGGVAPGVDPAAGTGGMENQPLPDNGAAAGGTTNAGGGSSEEDMGGQGVGGAPPTMGTDTDGDGRPALAETPAEPDAMPALYDCDDTDQTIFRGAPEVCGDAKDNNCDGLIDEAECIDPVGKVPCQDHLFQGKVYAKCGKGVGDLWTQPKARLVCLQKGMDLVQIDSQAENDFILGLVADQTWTGATEVPETHKDYGLMSPTAEKWRWGVDDKVFFTGQGAAGKPVDGRFSKWGSSASGPLPDYGVDGTYNGIVCRASCQVIRTTQGGSWYDVCCNWRTGDGLCEARR